MEEQTTTSPQGGATPPTGPATGTASTGAIPAKQTATTLEEALARIAELERHSTNKEEQATRHGKELSAAQKKLAEYEAKERQAQEAALSEVEREKKRAAEAEAKIQEYQKQLIAAQVKFAAQSKGIIDPDLAALAVEKSLEFGDDGMPSNLDKALDELIKAKPFLVTKPAEQTTTPATTASHTNPPATPAMNPGRTNIASPTAQPPGRIPRLTDPGMFKS